MMRSLLLLAALMGPMGAQSLRERLFERFGHPITAVNESATGEVWAAGYLLFNRPGEVPKDPFPEATRLGAGDARSFVVKLQADGQVAWATYFGTSSLDVTGVIRVDSQGRPVLAGWANGFDFPTTENALPKVYAQGPFLMRFAADGKAVDYATLLPFSDVADVAIDARDRLWLTGADANGRAGIGNLAGGNCLISRTASRFACTDAWVALIAADGRSLEWGTYAGGSGCAEVCMTSDPEGGIFPRGADSARGITIDDRGLIYVAGLTTSTDFPSTPETVRTSADAFLLVVDPVALAIVSTTVFGSPASEDPDDIYFEDGMTVVTGKVGRAGGVSSTSGVSISPTGRFTERISPSPRD